MTAGVLRRRRRPPAWAAKLPSVAAHTIHLPTDAEIEAMSAIADPTTANRVLALLGTDGRESHFIRTLRDDHTPYERHYRMRYIGDDLLRENITKQVGVHVLVNRLKSTATTAKQEDILFASACFADGDGAPKPQRWPLVPHMIAERSPTRWHAYWLIHPHTNLLEWRDYQNAIATHLGSDPNMGNPNRLLRLPGTVHHKDPANPTTYQLTHFDPSMARYSMRHVMDAFPRQEPARKPLAPVLPPSHFTPEERNRRAEAWQRSVEEETWAEGTRHQRLYRLACWGFEVGVNENTMLGVLGECARGAGLPDREILTTVRDAGKHVATGGQRR